MSATFVRHASCFVKAHRCVGRFTYREDGSRGIAAKPGGNWICASPRRGTRKEQLECFLHYGAAIQPRHVSAN